MGFAYPWVLALLPLALLPWLRPAQRLFSYPWLAQIPADRWSDALGWLLRAAGSAALVAVVLGMAGPYRQAVSVERIGKGAEIVLLLDRSRSMDESFITGGRPNTLMGTRARHSKRRIARRLLSEFVARRGEDRFGMVVFSTFPMRVLELTERQEAIQAAIRASDVGRGLGETDIGQALEATLGYFRDRPYTGSRIIMLVSDGGAHIEPAVRERVADQMRRYRVTLYWIYIRSYRSPGLMSDAQLGEDSSDAVPEHFLHRFFLTMGTPYRAYQAENPQDLQRAIADVSRLENLPIRLTEVLPARDVAGWCYATALVLALLLAGARMMEIRTWR